MVEVRLVRRSVSEGGTFPFVADSGKNSVSVGLIENDNQATFELLGDLSSQVLVEVVGHLFDVDLPDGAQGDRFLTEGANGAG